MDELARGAFLALVGVATGGVLAILVQHMADRRVDERLKRAVRAEMYLNVATARTLTEARQIEPLPRMRRDAWSAAHALALDADSFAALAAFYLQVDRYEEFAISLVAYELNIGGPFVGRREDLAKIADAVLERYDRAKDAMS